MDLAAINGPWQAITFLNFFLHDEEKITSDDLDILLYELSPELENLCKEIFLNFGYKKEFKNLNSLLNDYSKNYENIWIAKLFSENPKLIVNHFKSSSIILFEEGLHSYLSMNYFTIVSILKSKQSYKEKYKDIIKYFQNDNVKLYKNKLYNNLIHSEHISRIKSKYLLLENISYDKNIIIQNQHINNIIKKIYTYENLIPIDYNSESQNVFIIGQYFSELKIVNKIDEYNVYEKIIEYYLKNNFTVYWKSHPRTDFLESSLCKKFNSEQFKIIKSKYPIELLLAVLGGAKVAGVSSSALIYNRYLFHGESQQIAFALKDGISPTSVWRNEFKNMFELIDKLIPRLPINN